MHAHLPRRARDKHIYRETTPKKDDHRFSSGSISLPTATAARFLPTGNCENAPFVSTLPPMCLVVTKPVKVAVFIHTPLKKGRRFSQVLPRHQPHGSLSRRCQRGISDQALRGVPGALDLLRARYARCGNVFFLLIATPFLIF